MRPRRSTVRRAFTLVEILTSLMILGIIGLAFVRLITSQARFTEGQMAMRNARTVSRNSMNIMLTDLRMVEDRGGLVAATSDSITVRVPVAFGLLCAAGATPTMQILPVDSAMTAMGYYSGWAYRDSASGMFTYLDAVTPVSLDPNPPNNFGGNPATTTCTDSTFSLGIQKPGILPINYRMPNGTVRSSRVISLTDPLIVGTPNPGWPIFLYQQITYRFQGSTAYPGRIGLYRKVRSNTPGGLMVDEIIAPFDASAKFRYYMLNADVAVDGPVAVADLNSVRGLELNLTGSSPRAQQGKNSAVEGLVTGVFFKNRRDP